MGLFAKRMQNRAASAAQVTAAAESYVAYLASQQTGWLMERLNCAECKPTRDAFVAAAQDLAREIHAFNGDPAKVVTIGNAGGAYLQAYRDVVAILAEIAEAGPTT